MVIEMNKVKDWIKNHKFIIFIFLFSLILRIGVILVIDTPVISDFKTMLDASLEIVNKTDHYKTMPYFLLWGYQMGHVLYQSILLSIINSITFLKVVNAIVTSLTVVMIYVIGKKIANEKAAEIISIIYSIFLFPLLLNTVLTNQLLPMLLILIAIYLWITKKKEKKIMAILIGLLLGFSNMLRSETIVILFAFFLYTIFLMIKKEHKKVLIMNLAIIILTYFILTTSSSFLLKATNISPSGLDNKNTAWKFLEGLNIESQGRYSEEDASIYATSEEKTKEELVKRIKEDWQQYPILFLKKIKILWFNSDLSWQLGYIKDQDKILLPTAINQVFIYFFIIMSLFSSITLFKKNYKKEQILIILILLVYFGVYLGIEVMPRYAYSIQIFESLLAVITLGYMIDQKKENKVGEKHAKTRK